MYTHQNEYLTCYWGLKPAWTKRTVLWEYSKSKINWISKIEKYSLKLIINVCWRPLLPKIDYFQCSIILVSIWTKYTHTHLYLINCVHLFLHSNHVFLSKIMKILLSSRPISVLYGVMLTLYFIPPYFLPSLVFLHLNTKTFNFTSLPTLSATHLDA